MFEKNKILNIELILITVLCIGVYLYWKQMAFGYIFLLISAIIISTFYIIVGLISAFKSDENKEAKISWLTFAYGMGAGILGIMIKILNLPNAGIFFYLSFIAVAIAVIVIYKLNDKSKANMLNRLFSLSGIHFLMFILQRLL
jgi:hypothetical protein